MNKRIAVLFLAILLSISFVACNSGSNESSKTESTMTSTNSESSEKSELLEKSQETEKSKALEESTTSETSTIPKDTIPPAFLNASNGKLAPIEHKKGEEVDLLQGVIARDNLTKDADVVVMIANNGGYDKNLPGTYTITIQAEDEAKNKSTVTRAVTVIDKTPVKISELSIGTEQSPYSYNEKDALSYTSSGTKFRAKDVIQVMTKEFFVDEYKKHTAEHTNNGLIPFFPNGVLVVIDNDMKIQQVRIAAGENIQINSDGKLKTSELSWTNSLDAANGGGLFKGLILEIESIIPGGGYVIAVGNEAPEACRKFLISHLLYSAYAGGAVAADNKDIEITNIKVKLLNPVT